MLPSRCWFQRDKKIVATASDQENTVLASEIPDLKAVVLSQDSFYLFTNTFVVWDDSSD